MRWQAETGYGKRNHAETGVFRIKSINGGQLNARTFGAQMAEVRLAIAAANKMIWAAKPGSVRIR